MTTTTATSPVPYNVDQARALEGTLRALLVGKVVTDRHGHAFRVEELTHNHHTAGEAGGWKLLTNNWSVSGRITTPAPQDDVHPRDARRWDDWTYLTFGYHDVPAHTD